MNKCALVSLFLARINNTSAKLLAAFDAAYGLPNKKESSLARILHKKGKEHRK